MKLFAILALLLCACHLLVGPMPPVHIEPHIAPPLTKVSD